MVRGGGRLELRGDRLCHRGPDIMELGSSSDLRPTIKIADPVGPQRTRYYDRGLGSSQEGSRLWWGRTSLAARTRAGDRNPTLNSGPATTRYEGRLRLQEARESDRGPSCYIGGQRLLGWGPTVA